jgi:hypothetical protein
MGGSLSSPDAPKAAKAGAQPAAGGSGASGVRGAAPAPAEATAALYACKREACAIQDCLAAHDYQEAPCVRAIAALVACCDAAAPGAPAPVQCSFGRRYRALVEAQAGHGGGSGGGGGGGGAA